MRVLSSLAMFAIAVCVGALVAACLSRESTSPSCSCCHVCGGAREEIAPAQLRITGASPRDLIGAAVDVTTEKVVIRTTEGQIVFEKVDR